VAAYDECDKRGETGASTVDEKLKGAASTFCRDLNFEGMAMGRFASTIRFLCLGCALIYTESTAIAADMSIIRGHGKEPETIVISGQLEYGDDYRFVKLAFDNPTVGVVVLFSPGGSLDAGLLMARALVTVVPPNATCASACALAWLGGSKRFLGDKSRLGFHAAHIERGGVRSESGVGNALVGAFLNEIGLSKSAVIYITHAPPDRIQWLTIEDATALGIQFEFLVPRPDSSTSVKAPAVAKPERASRWIEQRAFWRVRQGISQGRQNVRRGPGTMHEIEFSMPAGASGIAVTECRKPDDGGGNFDWCRVTWNGQSGWTSSNGLEVDVSSF
jgi:hypothetical protein